MGIKKRPDSSSPLGKDSITQGGVLVEKHTAVVDLKKNGTYVVNDGKLTPIPCPPGGYGKQVINWQGGKPCNGLLEESIKF